MKKILTKLTEEEFKHFLGIWFCQPKFYIPSVWNNAKEIMEYLVTKWLVENCDYWRWKWKYTTGTINGKKLDIDDVQKKWFEVYKKEYLNK